MLRPILRASIGAGALDILFAFVTACQAAHNPSTIRCADGPPPRPLRERRGSE